jgi:hypothetical protein
MNKFCKGDVSILVLTFYIVVISCNDGRKFSAVTCSTCEIAGYLQKMLIGFTCYVLYYSYITVNYKM